MRTFLLSLGLIVLISHGAYSQNPFQTRQTGNWNDANTWEEDTGGGFAVTANTPTSASGTITIRNTHTVTVTTNVTIDQTTVQSGGVLTVNGAITLSINPNASGLNISSGATLNNNGIINQGGLGNRFVVVDGTVNHAGSFAGATVARLVFNSGSNYNHQFADGAAIPTASWNANSTVNIVGYTSGNLMPPSGLGQTFGNFTWNSPGQDVTISLNAGLTNVLGNLSFVNTGPNGVYFSLSGTGFTLAITGSLVIGNSGVVGVSSLDSGPSTLSVGSISISGAGYIQFAEDQDVTVNISGDFTIAGTSIVEYSANGANTTLNLSGNYVQTGGSVQSTVGSGTINFVGTGSQTVTSSTVATGNIGYSVANTSTVSIPGNNFISGTGTLTVNGGLNVGSTNSSGAIQTGVSNGNVRVGGIRTYNSGSTITYSGSPSFIGSGHPISSGVNVIINSSGTSLFGNRTIGGNLTLTSGNLTVGANTLTLNGNFTPNSNSIVVSPTSSLSIGGSGAFGSLAITGGPTINNLTLNRTATGSITLVSNLSIAGTFTQTAGVVNLNGNTLTIGGAFSRVAGELNGTGSSSLVINGVGALPAGVAINGTLNTVTLNRASSTLATLGSFNLTNLNLLSGTFQNGGTITLATNGLITRDTGSLTGAGIISAATTYDVLYTNTGPPISTGSELPSDITQLRNLTINSSGQINLNAAATINGLLTLTSGVFNAGGFPIDLKGNLESNNPSILTSSSITFSGATSISGSTPVIFGNVTVTVTGSLTPTSALAINGNLVNNGTLNSGSGTVTFGGTTAISGSSTSSFNNVVINGSLTAPSSSMNVSGTWTNNGTFTNNTGTVVFNGTSTIAGATTNFGGLTISGSLTSPTTLNVARDFSNNGTFTAGTGTLVLNGSANQSIQGSSLTTFNNISVTNSAQPTAVQIQSNQNLRGVLTLAANSVLDADGSSNTSVLTLLSTNDNLTADASIATLPNNASVTGDVTVQRFMAIEGANSGRIYRFISSPVSGAAVSQIQAFIPVIGPFTGADASSTGFQSMFSYNESDITGNFDTGYINFPAAANTETFAPGVGYAIFVQGNVAPVSSAGSALFALRGPINAGNRSLPVSFTSSAILANDGWNLVGNPYPSTIDWDAGGWTKTNINNAIYMRDNGQASPVYATYVAGVPTNGGTRHIPTGQAFFVKSDGGSPVLSATESVKVAGTQSTFFREETINNILRIDLSKGGIKDEIVIRFAENSTESFDPKMDAYKLKNGSATSPVLNLSSISKEKFQMAINAAGPPIKCGSVNRKSIALSVDNVSSGSHTLTFREFESFSSDVKIVLKDSFRGDSLVVTPQSNQYVFDVTSDVMSFGEKRFTLTFSCPSIVTALNEPTIDMEVKIYPNPTEGSFQIQIPSVQGTRVSIINSIGGNVGEVLLLDDSKYQTGSFELYNPPVGVYLVKIINGNKVVTKKVIKK